MSKLVDSRTSLSLLGRLGQATTDQAAWAQFVDRYAPCIYQWCCQWRLPECDAQDVTQDVLMELAEKMRGFRYNPEGSFRGWLRTLTRHAWVDFLARRQRAGRGSGDSQALARLHSIEARDDLARRLEEEFDGELLEQAMEQVRHRAEPRTWEAFRLLALEGWSGAQVAEHLGMNVATVFVARSHVQKRIREEVRRLEAGHAEDLS